MATTTNYGWTTPDDTALVKDGASAIRTLGSSVDTTTKALNPSTTLGDIEYRSSTANTNTRLPLGTAGQVLQVNSGATAPEWATINSGGMTLLSTTTLSGSSTTISSISGSYKNLYIIGINMYLNTGDDLYMRLNSDTGNNYQTSKIKLSTSTLSGDTNVTSSFFIGSVGSLNQFDANGFMRIEIPRYAETQVRQIHAQNRTYAGGNQLYYNMMGIYNSTTAISSVTFLTAGGATFSAGTVYVYGVK